jgi:acetyl-CoA carboxylase biotin carboxyl carrier protein
VELRAELMGTVWKVLKRAGEAVGAGESVVILESMKMEIPVAAPQAGTVREVRVAEGAVVQEGDVLAVVD